MEELTCQPQGPSVAKKQTWGRLRFHPFNSSFTGGASWSLAQAGATKTTTRSGWRRSFPFLGHLSTDLVPELLAQLVSSRRRPSLPRRFRVSSRSKLLQLAI